MGLSRARHLTPLYTTKIGVNHRALVIGGGLAGMTAARALSAQGFEAHLVEKESELGGNLRRLHYTLEENGVQGYLADLIERVKRDPLIHVYTRARVERVEGCVGNFTTTVRSAEFEVRSGADPNIARHMLDTSHFRHYTLHHGVIIVATGAAELQGDDYLRGWDERVMTQRELEERIANSQSQISNLKSIVMIQCVGSRDAERPYCSRICCSQALKNALKVKEINPETEVIVLYRDLMSYGLKEEYYTRARAAGVIFIRYDVDHPPQVRSLKAVRRRGETTAAENGPSPLAVTVRDANLGAELTLVADLLALSVATVAPQENQELAHVLKAPLDGDGFFLEAHMKLRPVDFATDGIFVCGLAHSPKFMEETIAQSQAAAARAAAILSRAQIESEAMVPVISLEKCIGCALCQTVCAFQAIRVTETEIGKRAEVMLAACKGCGLCGAACPYGAIALSNIHVPNARRARIGSA
jgi:heterodisulfide reductase subunit A